MEDIFLTYKIENVLTKSIIEDYNVFCKIVRKVFPEAAGRTKKKSISHLRWKDSLQLHQDLNAVYNAEFISQNLLTSYHVIEKTDRYVRAITESQVEVNKQKIWITVEFHSNLSIHANISGKNIDLIANHISETYIPTKAGLESKCREIQTLQICLGRQFDESQLNHIIRHSNMMEETLTVKNQLGIEKEKILRSSNCLYVAPITGRSRARCIKCIRMQVREQEQDVKTNPNTEDLIRKLLPNVPKSMFIFIMSQIQNSAKENKRSYRWDASVISECLNLYTRTPQGYISLRDSGMVLLPSPQLLILYKNSIDQHPGFHQEIFSWMHAEAERLNIPQEGRIGGLLLDEMSIQESIDIVKSGKYLELVGFTDMGEEGNSLKSIREGRCQQTPSTHVLQFLFQGIGGFRFPFAHFLSKQVSASDLYCVVWEAVDHLRQYGFNVKYISMDGAVSNRSLLHMHFPDNDQIEKCMTTQCPTNPFESMVMMMDPSHCFKKIRNGILSSGQEKGSKRRLKLTSGHVVMWNMWIDAYRWDCTNPIQIHRSLTNEHLFPSTVSKMRNKLAEDVLDYEMLNLMLSYKDSLGEKGKILDGAVELLMHTSKIISTFRDRRPIHTIEDERLKTNKEAQLWFWKWECEVNASLVTPAEKRQSLLSKECLEDIQSCLLGFQQLCLDLIQQNSGWSIVPAMINSDAIENQFCQHRGKFNGLNTNPTALQYRQDINGVILGEGIISKKSNAGKENMRCHSYNITMNKALNKKRKNHMKDGTISPVKCIRL
jgi:hypothetical protein